MELYPLGVGGFGEDVPRHVQNNPMPPLHHLGTELLFSAGLSDLRRCSPTGLIRLMSDRTHRKVGAEKSRRLAAIGG